MPIKINSHGLQAVLVILVLALVPIFVHSPYVLHLAVMSMIFSVLTMSWNFINGYSGIFTFGHQAFFALGAYGSALVAMNFGLSPWATLWVGVLLGGLAGLLIGLPVLRIRSIAHIAIITLVFAEVVRLCIANLPELTRGTLGLSSIPVFDPLVIGGEPWVTFDVSSRIGSYYLILLIVAITLGIIIRLLNGRTGLALKAIRDSEDAAESLGIDLVRYKLIVFVISSMLAGLAGAFYAHYLGVLTPESTAAVDIMILILTMTLIGGTGTIFGPILGAFVIIFGLEQLRAIGNYRMMVYGLALVIFVLFWPKGLIQFFRRRPARN
ncbi:branched-chain amino acid ABC transporter permease [Castellaniella sp.]|uniref:branched-chain amino acid ABC transporter permease n=1 Tax=Castellaniella sp. TaxID=1955812 RepID=UPI0035603301